MSPEDVLDAPRLTQALAHYEVNIMFMTVALFNQSVDALQPYLPRMRYLLIGGEAINPDFVRQPLRDNPPQNFLNGYGPTETTTFCDLFSDE
ncbi:AMP-binding protein [Vibrio sp. PP-XX7]